MLITPRGPIQGLIIVTLSLLAFGVKSGTELDYLWSEGGRVQSRTVELQEGHLRIRNIRPKPAADLYYDGSKSRWMLVDHDHRRLLMVDGQSLQRLSGEIALLAPLLGGLDGSLEHLSPSHKKIWTEWLQGIPLELFQRPTRKPSTPRKAAVAPAEGALGLSCAPQTLALGTLSLEGCMADPDQPALNQGDRANLESLITQLNTLLGIVAPWAQGLGIKPSTGEAPAFRGLPLRLVLSGTDWDASLQLKALRSVAFKPKFLGVPKNYSAEKARLW